MFVCMKVFFSEVSICTEDQQLAATFLDQLWGKEMNKRKEENAQTDGKPGQVRVTAQ